MLKTDTLDVIQGYLKGKMLIATPSLDDAFFSKSVILLHQHDETGASGFILNKIFPNLSLSDLFLQYYQDYKGDDQTPILFGGPVEIDHGYIVHSSDFSDTRTNIINKDLSVTESLSALQRIAKGASAPSQFFVALGHASWTSGQLESEIKEGTWIVSEPDLNLIFANPSESKWHRALDHYHINPTQFSPTSGRA